MPPVRAFGRLASGFVVGSGVDAVGSGITGAGRWTIEGEPETGSDMTEPTAVPGIAASVAALQPTRKTATTEAMTQNVVSVLALRISRGRSEWQFGCTGRSKPNINGGVPLRVIRSPEPDLAR